MSSCRIYEEDTKAHNKVMNELKGKSQQSRLKPYSAPADKGKQRVDERRPRRKDTPTEIVCYKCNGKGHKSNACPEDDKRCFHCGKKGHTITECKHGDMVCFNCEEECHIGSQCKKPKKVQAGGKVFSLTGTQTVNEDCLIRGTCFFNSTPLTAIIDTGATHCFIAVNSTPLRVR